MATISKINPSVNQKMYLINLNLNVSRFSIKSFIAAELATVQVGTMELLDLYNDVRFVPVNNCHTHILFKSKLLIKIAELRLL